MLQEAPGLKKKAERLGRELAAANSKVEQVGRLMRELAAEKSKRAQAEVEASELRKKVEDTEKGLQSAAAPELLGEKRKERTVRRRARPQARALITFASPY